MRGMTVLAAPERGVDPRRVPLDVEIAVPVYNEAEHLAERITALRNFLNESFPFRALVTIVDNASTDETMAVATELAATLPGVAALHLSQKGRGRRPAHRLVDQHGAGGGLHGRRLVHLALRPAAAGGSPPLGASRRRCRAPAWPAAPT